MIQDTFRQHLKLTTEDRYGPFKRDGEVVHMSKLPARYRLMLKDYEQDFGRFDEKIEF